MNRREFLTGGLSVTIVGCGQENEVAQEYTLEQSPLRQSNAINTPVPSYIEYKTENTTRVDTGAAANVGTQFRLVRVGAAVTMTWFYNTAITTSSAANYVTLGPLIPSIFWPKFEEAVGLVGVEDNGGSLVDPGVITVGLDGKVTVAKSILLSTWTTSAGMAVNSGSLSWTTIE